MAKRKRATPDVPAPPAISLGSDKPISTPAEDRFDRAPFCRGLAEAIVSLQEPDGLVVGIYGVWGDGKTSALRLLESALLNSESAVVVPFNPWLIQGEVELLKGLLAQLVESVGKRLATGKERFGQALEKFGGLIPSLPSVPVSGDTAKALGRVISATKIEELRDRVDSILAQNGKRVVVLVDDVDRLDKNEIATICRVIKLTANFRQAVYVLAFDDEVVARALGSRYGDSPADGRRFLEKIVQVPLRLPPAHPEAVRRLALETIFALVERSGIAWSEQEQRAFVLTFDESLLPGLRTPRQIRLLANASSFALPLLRGEVNVSDLLLFEGMRALYPKLYETVRDHPDIMLGSQGGWNAAEDQRRRNEVITSGLAGLDPEQAEGARHLLFRLFPPLRENVLFGNEEKRQWGTEKRICSAEYFKRYFTYAVPSADIPDSEVSAFLDALDVEDGRRLRARLERLAHGRDSVHVVFKIRQQENRISLSGAAVLALLVARNGDLFPFDEMAFPFTSAGARAGILVAHLLRRPLLEGQTETAVEVMETASSPSLAAECFAWLGPVEGEPLIPEEALRTVALALCRRIAAEAAQEPHYLRVPRRAAYIFAIWKQFGPEGEVGRYLGDRLAEHPEEAVKLITAYVPISTNVEGGDRVLADFEGRGYTALSRVIEPAIVENALRASLGSALDEELGGNASFELRVAHRFVELRRASEARPEGP